MAISVRAWVRREKKIKGEHPTRQELGRLNTALPGGQGELPKSWMSQESHRDDRRGRGCSQVCKVMTQTCIW